VGAGVIRGRNILEGGCPARISFFEVQQGQGKKYIPCFCFLVNALCQVEEGLGGF
jgi:hypothetical protein